MLALRCYESRINLGLHNMYISKLIVKSPIYAETIFKIHTALKNVNKIQCPLQWKQRAVGTWQQQHRIIHMY